VLASLTPIIKGDSHLCNGIASLDAGLTTNNSKFDTYLWNTGDTIQKITVTAAGVYSVKVTQSGCTGQANFTVAVSPEVTLSVNAQPETCANEPNFGIDYNLLTGELGSYEVLFDQKATQAGFTDMPKQAVTGTQFVILLPANVRPNIYNAVLKVYEKNCGDSTLYPIDFKVKYDTTVMTQRWNDVIGVKNSAYNGGYTFTGFQWYKNGAALSGQTSSNLYVSAFLNVSDRYSVMLTRNDGVILPTCDFAPTLLTSADIVPTFVSPSQVISLKTICTSGIVSYTDITGRVESRQPVGADNTSTQVPAQKGMYILQIATEDENKQYKIIVK